jgi:hypothetical protein
MVIIMDTQAGKRIEEPVDAYGEEVLNANWLPEAELRPGLREPASGVEAGPEATQDVEAFLAAVYRYQE